MVIFKNFILFFLVFFLNTKLLIATENNNNLKKINIAVSINPLFQIVKAITADKTNNFLIFNDSFSEHNYQLTTLDVKALNSADLVLIIDKSFEKNLAKYLTSTTKKNEVIAVSEIEKMIILNEKNNPKKIDYHLWLEPKNAEIIGQFLTQKLCLVDSKNCDFYQKNLKSFKQQNKNFTTIINQKITKINDHKFIFYRDCYQYLQNAFGLSVPEIADNNHSQDIKFNKLKQIEKIINDRQINCLIGDYFDEKNSALKLASKHQINFAKVDIIGLANSNKNLSTTDNLNGYHQIIFNIIVEIEQCQAVQ